MAALAAVCGFAAPAPAQPGGHSHSHSHGVAAPPSDTVNWTAADVEFMTGMIGHHAQAIEMAHLAPGRAEANSVQILAARIISAQEDEIATMRQWLVDRGQPVPPILPTAQHHHGGGHEMMPGMLSAAQMEALTRASGAEFDQMFLQLMIQHHRGAVSMVRRLFGSHGAGQEETVFRFATDVNVDQETEIVRMQRMLASLLFGTPIP